VRRAHSEKPEPLTERIWAKPERPTEGLSRKETKMNKVNFWWDNQEGIEPGWYIEVTDSDLNFITDSMKFDFPVDADEFGEEEGARLFNVLEGAFPGCQILRGILA